MAVYQLMKWIAIVILLVGAAAHAQTVDAKLELVPDRTLAEIPVSFIMTLTNHTDHPVCVPRVAVLHVDPWGRKPFVVQTQPSCAGCSPAVVLPEDSEPLLPGGLKVIAMKTNGRFRTPVWFQDRRLSDPGIYDIEVLFAEGEQGIEGIYVGEHETPVAMAVAQLRVDEPQGKDAILWRDIRSLGGSASTVSAAVTRFPSSPYTGWLAASVQSETPEQTADLLAAWLAQAPRDELTDDRQFLVAVFDLYAVGNLWESNRAVARVHLERAKGILQRLMKSADEQLRADAASRMKDAVWYDDANDER